ncbi:PEP-CTERM sorting domain-containing protein [Verrucomicrobiaceae bacterium 5K15]|uniref:PEP-CTERM sorting domain-containing protein n=1 Tax=Oceaniferula flava TaxID=2800421 RepID=A0AAE2V9T3_9BACT|nr:PEP-CTERM sorting domain-containing protein [Oceaniferula flavus]MBK1855688.1 PEP-CTERM sorting domain-containing protein [Oceaniferula flavus]MBM1136994.1 PEP-CTERM sorting domain-containing protein [Oceaniferula flavus]
MSTHTLPLLLALISAPCLLAQSVANLDFSYAHGTVIDEQYAPLGITISVNGGQNIGIVYDSELGGINGDKIDGADNDLERLSSAGNPTGWDGGNLGTDYNAGGLLIIQENAALASAPTYGSGENQITSASNYNPDDNASGGTISFDINENLFDYHYFSVTLADFEEDGLSYSTTLYGINGTIETYSFSDFTDPTNPRYDASIVGGDNFINSLPELSLSTGEKLSQVDIKFDNSSGSVSGIVFSQYPVPEPSSITLLGLGAMGLLLRRRR